MEDWRKAVFSRDDFTCQICGIKGGYLEADHIKPFSTHHDLRFELSNGRTLCRPCHMKTDTWGYKGGKIANDAPQPKIA
jgi:5-methylcytosine-specific restriction endonuclease McrA